MGENVVVVVVVDIPRVLIVLLDDKAPAAADRELVENTSPPPTLLLLRTSCVQRNNVGPVIEPSHAGLEDDVAAVLVIDFRLDRGAFLATAPPHEE